MPAASIHHGMLLMGRCEAVCCVDGRLHDCWQARLQREGRLLSGLRADLLPRACSLTTALHSGLGADSSQSSCQFRGLKVPEAKSASELLMAAFSRVWGLPRLHEAYMVQPCRALTSCRQQRPPCRHAGTAWQPSGCSHCSSIFDHSCRRRGWQLASAPKFNPQNVDDPQAWPLAQLQQLAHYCLTRSLVKAGHAGPIQVASGGCERAAGGAQAQ